MELLPITIVSKPVENLYQVFNIQLPCPASLGRFHYLRSSGPDLSMDEKLHVSKRRGFKSRLADTNEMRQSGGWLRDATCQYGARSLFSTDPRTFFM